MLVMNLQHQHRLHPFQYLHTTVRVALRFFQLLLGLVAALRLQNQMLEITRSVAGPLIVEVVLLPQRHTIAILVLY